MKELKYIKKQLLLVIVLLNTSICKANSVKITTVQGALEGDQHDGYISFKGIPYATISNSTSSGFWRTGPAPTWKGVRSSQKVSCQQDNPQSCLTLDVHVPATGSTSKPILVLAVHFNANFQPEKLVKQDVILVILSYRIGAVGFVCTKDKRIPGNAGLYDLVTGLRWVRDNAAAFMGNPARVVVGGQGLSAGLVEALTFLPTAKGLFHAIILQSGSILSPISFNYDANKRANTLARLLDNQSNEDSVEVLLANYRNLWDDSVKMKYSYYPFALCVQDNSFNEALITETPLYLLKNKKVIAVPVLIGYNSQEGYIFAKTLKSSSMVSLLPYELKFRNDKEADRVNKRIEDTYFSDGSNLKKIIDYLSDMLYINHVHRSARIHARSPSPVYYYQFSLASDLGVTPVSDLTKTGAAHSDELAFLFGGNITGVEGGVQNQLVKLWANFVKFSNPTPPKSGLSHWDTLDPGNPRIMDIGQQLKMAPFPRSSEATIWDEIMDTYYYGRNQQ